MAGDHALRIGYVPEHFSTPLHFARAYYSMTADLVAFPSGTGHMITALQNDEIDIGIGLTEGWITGLGKAHSESRGAGYKLVGQYVETPLCWAISAGASRHDIQNVENLRGSKIGVSRIGSGSYVMGFVLADQHGWLTADDNEQSSNTSGPFQVVPLQTFAGLRQGVNDGTADFFMWEVFTSQRYYDNGEIRKIGEIYTPWPSWEIVVKPGLVGDPRLEQILEQINLGINHFRAHPEKAIRYISTELDYSEEDAREWMKTVKFADDVRGTRISVVQKVVGILRKAGVLQSDIGEDAIRSMIAIARKE